MIYLGLTYLAIEKDEYIHDRESKAWLARNIDSIRVTSMNEGIEKANDNKFLYIGINAANINYMPKLRLLREVTNDPILISTTSYTMQEQGKAISLGADLFGQISDNPHDNIESVMALINRLDERSNKRKESTNVINYGNILIAPDYHQVFLGETEIMLTKIEIKVLYYLIDNRGRVLSHQQIYHHLWNDEYQELSYDIIKNVIKRLRKKINDNGENKRIVENVRGIGFRVPILP